MGEEKGVPDSSGSTEAKGGRVLAKKLKGQVSYNTVIRLLGEGKSHKEILSLAGENGGKRGKRRKLRT